MELRQHVGHGELWLTGVTAVVTKEDHVLLVKSHDHGLWSPVTGILEPGEQPADTAARESLEEAGVHVVPTKLAQTSVTDLITYPNGDQARFLDLTFLCQWRDGEPKPDNDEIFAVQWFPQTNLPEMRPHMVSRIEAALSGSDSADFEFNG